MVATTSLLYRLGIEGDDQVKARLASVGDEETKQINRTVAAADAKAQRIAAIERQLEAAKKSSNNADEKAIALILGESKAYEDLQRKAGSLAPALAKVNTSAGQLRAGTQQLAFQISDVATSFAGGINPMVIFAQQGSQVVQSIALMQGEAKGLIGFLSGPWGAAIMGAVTIAGVFGAKLLEGGDNAKEAKKQLDDFRKSVEDLAEAQGKALLSEQQQARQVAITAENYRLATIRARERIAVMLDEARIAAQEALAINQRGGRGAAEAATVTGPLIARLRQLEADSAANKSLLDKATSGANAALSNYIAGRVAQASTPQGAVNQRYDNLIANAKQEAARTRDFAREAQEIQRLSKARDAELEALQKSTKARTRDADTSTASPAEISRMLREAIPGVQITSTTGGKHVDNSYHYKGQAVDFVPKGGMNSMTKEDVRRLFTARGINIVELLGPGDAGHSDHFHVAWTKGKLALDNFVASAKEAAAEKRDLMQLFGLYDPAAEGAAKYADQLDRIAKLVRSGALSDTDASNLRRAARLAQFDANAAPPPNAEANLQAVGIDMNRPLFSDAQIEAQNRKLAKEIGAIDDKIAPVIDLLDVMRDHGRDAIDAITDPANWENMGDVAKSVIQGILRDLAQLAISNPLKNLLFGGDSQGNAFPTFGSGGGIFKSIFSLFGGGGGYGNIFGDSIGFATGTAFAPGGWATVGENGPERVRLPRGSQVLSSSATRAAMRGGNDNPQITMPISIYAPGADAAALARVEAKVEGLRRDLPSLAVAAVSDARQRRVG